MSRSSRGLGRQILNLVARVRIPYGVQLGRSDRGPALFFQGVRRFIAFGSSFALERSKTVPKTRPSVLPLNSPQMRRNIRVNVTGVTPCESWGLISLPLADLPFGGFWICSTPPSARYSKRNAVGRSPATLARSMTRTSGQ